jgi:hypothetical protein
MLTDELSELARLRELASKATPGPWAADPGIVASDYAWSVYADRGGGQGPEVCHCGQGEHDARFIAAASPATVLALLDSIRELQARLLDALQNAPMPMLKLDDEQARLVQAVQEAAALRARVAELEAFEVAAKERVAGLVTTNAELSAWVTDLQGDARQLTAECERFKAQRDAAAARAGQRLAERDAALATLERVRDVLTVKYEAAYDLRYDIEAALASPR